MDAPALRPVADPVAAVRSFFDAEALDYAHNRERQYSFVSQRDLVLQLLPEGVGRVLDLGCGPAVMAEPLLERGAEVWGVDAAEQMIELGRARMAMHRRRERLHLRVGTL